MYQAINNFVIVQPYTELKETASGIVLEGTPRYKVTATTEETRELQDKVIITANPLPLDDGYFSVDYKSIIAVCD